MYFGLSEEQQSLQDNIKKYLEDNASLDTIKEVAKGDLDKAQNIHKGLIELGISGLMVPEQYGGLELDMLFAVVVAGALGSGTAPVPYSGAYVMAPIALSLGGDDSQKEYWLPKIAGGEAIIGVGISEYIGAREDADIAFSDGKISGRSLFVIDGKDVTALTPSQKLSEAGIAYILQDKSVFPQMTVEENLLMGGFLKDRPAEAKAAAEMVFDKYSRLADRRDKPAGVLSGGERRLHAEYGIGGRRDKCGSYAQCGPDRLCGCIPGELLAIECLHVDLHLPSLSNRTALSHSPLVQSIR